MIARSPDQWSDVTSQGAPRAGRYIGDCESKVYMQTRLLTAAGFTSLGSVDVQHGGGIGHMLGVFRRHGEPPDHGRSGGRLDPPLDRAGHDAPDRSADRAAAAPARPEPGQARPSSGSGGPAHP